MTEENLVLVHTDLVYLGGEYDEETSRAFYGGEWEERINSATEEYDNLFSVAYLDEGSDTSFEADHIKRARELKDRTHLPYSFGSYENVIEDSNNGELSESEIEDLTSDIDTFVVGGVWLNDCVTRFIQSVTDYDPHIEIKVDPEYSAVLPNTPGPTGLGDREEILNRSIDEEERKMAESPPSALENQKRLETFMNQFKDEERVNLLEEKL